MTLAVETLLRVPHVALKQARAIGRKPFTGVSTDSRTVERGDLFIALCGERFDGHAFIADAVARGARAVMAEAGGVQTDPPRVPVMVVEDTTRSYGELARLHRSRFRIPVIAVAGSNGKTTTKEMVAAVLKERKSVVHTQGNLNNQIGVPATLLRIQRNHEIAVVELGTNHPGELAGLCRLVAPTHGLVTNIGGEHLAFFETMDGVEEEESTVYRTLARSARSVAFVNADDERVTSRAKEVRRKIRYAFARRRVEVKGKLLGTDDMGCARFSFSGRRMKAPATVQLRIPGQHNAVNALAAAAVGLTFGVAPDRIRNALEAFRAPKNRMETLVVEGVVIFNDAYNANADSAIASLRTLAGTRTPGKKIAVLGDMLELGAHEEEEHRRVGKMVGELGIDYLLTFGKRAALIRDSAGVRFAVHYEQKNMLAEYLAELVTPGDAVLIKGSRGMRMEDVTTFLVERLRPAPAAGRGTEQIAGG